MKGEKVSLDDMFPNLLRDEGSGGSAALAECWPVRDCLTTLADAAEHFLLTHDCDHHGHEQVRAAMLAARHHAANTRST